MKKTIYLVAFVVLVCLIFLTFRASFAQERIPSPGQSLAKLLWGHRAKDVWNYTFGDSVAGGDTVSVAFLFVNPDSSNTLDMAASAVIYAPDVTCTLYTYGDSNDFIDEDEPFIIKANEVFTDGAQVRWVRLVTTGPGHIRVVGYAD